MSTETGESQKLTYKLPFVRVDAEGNKAIQVAKPSQRECSAVPTKACREFLMSRYRRLKIEGGAFFYTLARADAIVPFQRPPRNERGNAK